MRIIIRNKEFEIATMPYLASDALFCLKKGENISAQEIRNSISGWRFVLYVDGNPVAEGGVTMDLNVIESCNDRIAAAKGYTTSYSGVDGKTAADFYDQA